MEHTQTGVETNQAEQNEDSSRRDQRTVVHYVGGSGVGNGRETCGRIGVQDPSACLPEHHERVLQRRLDVFEARGGDGRSCKQSNEGHIEWADRLLWGKGLTEIVGFGRLSWPS